MKTRKGEYDLVKSFFLSFIFVYLLISLPYMFGFGYVIDWVPEASLNQKLKGYVIEGLKYGLVLKLFISAFLGVLFTIIKKKSF